MYVYNRIAIYLVYLVVLGEEGRARGREAVNHPSSIDRVIVARLLFFFFLTRRRGVLEPRVPARHQCGVCSFAYRYIIGGRRLGFLNSGTESRRVTK